jgi:DNA-binding NarL/FixJ family response regulator
VFPITVALVDEQPLIVDGLVRLLSRTGGFHVVATGSSAQDVVDICRTHQPNVVVIDPSIAADIYELVGSVVRIAPNTKVVSFTAAQGVEPAIVALDAGAGGYVTKRCSSVELVRAIASARSGETYITRMFARNVIARLQNPSLRRKAAKEVVLKCREGQIAHLLMIGRTSEQIATALKISEKILGKHMAILRHKLQVHNRREEVIAARKYRSLVIH